VRPFDRTADVGWNARIKQLALVFESTELGHEGVTDAGGRLGAQGGLHRTLDDPGRTAVAFTVTPVPASSAARLAVSISNPALLTEYALAWPKPVPVAASVETFTLRPQRRARILGSTAWIQAKAPVRLMASAAAHAWTSISAVGPNGATTPALLMSPSTGPRPRSTCATATRTAAGSPTSQVTPLLACPTSRRRAATCAISSVERASTATLAPAVARAAAAAAPMPRPAPVTSATRPRTVYPLGSSMDHSFFLRVGFNIIFCPERGRPACQTGSPTPPTPSNRVWRSGTSSLRLPNAPVSASTTRVDVRLSSSQRRA